MDIDTLKYFRQYFYYNKKDMLYTFKYSIHKTVLYGKDEIRQISEWLGGPHCLRHTMEP